MNFETSQSQSGVGSITRWRCPNCGQLLFSAKDEHLPLRCAICHQPIEWQRHYETVIRWRCPNCGQTIFTAPDDPLPDMCHYCQDMTTWQPV